MHQDFDRCYRAVGSRDARFDGWFVTDDIGAVDDSSVLRVLGRIDDAIATGGLKVLPALVESALAGQSAVGGADGYVRGYSAGGAELFTKQFGTTGADATTALSVRDNGSGGFDIFTGGVENNRGVVRSFTYAPGNGFTAGATRDIGYFYKGAINAIAVEGSSLYVGGEIGADRLTLGTPASAAVAGQEGFVARMNVNLASTSLDRASYLGSAGDDAVKSLAVVNGEVYAAGLTIAEIMWRNEDAFRARSETEAFVDRYREAM